MANIVVAEDDNVFRGVLVEALSIAGHEVREAPHGMAAMRFLDASPADLFITDLVMPEQEGIETIMEARVKFPALPIIAISGHVENSPMYLELARKLGARKTLKKPFPLTALLDAVAEVLSDSAETT